MWDIEKAYIGWARVGLSGILEELTVCVFWAWCHIIYVLMLQKLADYAQQSFSSDHGPSLHHTLPSLEALHKTWSVWLKQNNYWPFHLALVVAIEKIEEYYEKTAGTDAFNLAMCMHHFNCHSSQAFSCLFMLIAHSTWPKQEDGAF